MSLRWCDVIESETHYEGANTDDIVRRIQQAALRGLRDSGEHILQLSRDRVPIDTGVLERSGMVTDNDADTVAVSYDTPYAVRVHEDMTARHVAGREAKYLETATGEAVPVVGQIVRRAVTTALGGDR